MEKWYDSTPSVVKQLKALPGIPCDVDPNVTGEDMFQALLTSCRHSRMQLEQAVSDGCFLRDDGTPVKSVEELYPVKK